MHILDFFWGKSGYFFKALSKATEHGATWRGSATGYEYHASDDQMMAAVWRILGKSMVISNYLGKLLQILTWQRALWDDFLGKPHFGVTVWPTGALVAIICPESCQWMNPEIHKIQSIQPVSLHQFNQFHLFNLIIHLITTNQSTKQRKTIVLWWWCGPICFWANLAETTRCSSEPNVKKRFWKAGKCSSEKKQKQNLEYSRWAPSRSLVNGGTFFGPHIKWPRF